MVSLRELGDNDFLAEYWAAGFPEEPTRPDRLATWFWSSAIDLLGGVGGFVPAAVVGAVLALGLAASVVTRSVGRRTIPLAVLPPLVLASSLDLYPFRGRLALFVLPMVLLVLASLVDLPGWFGVVAVLAVGLTSIGPMRSVAIETVDPTLFPETRHVVEYLADRRHPGDMITTHGLAAAPFAVYAGPLGMRADSRSRWRPISGCADEMASPLGTGRTWFVFSYTTSVSPADEMDRLLGHLDAAAKRLDLHRRHDALVALYDFSQPPDEFARRTVISDDLTGCLRVTKTLSGR